MFQVIKFTRVQKEFLVDFVFHARAIPTNKLYNNGIYYYINYLYVIVVIWELKVVFYHVSKNYIKNITILFKAKKINKVSLYVRLCFQVFIFHGTLCMFDIISEISKAINYVFECSYLFISSKFRTNNM